MADKKHVVVDLPKQQYLTVANEKLLNDSTVAQAETARKTSRISAITGLIIFSIAAAIPILQLYIGRRYSTDCPVDWHIPHYLIIAGLVGITIIIFGIIENILALKISANPAGPTLKQFPTAVFFCVVILILVLISFLFVWFVAGCYWIYRSWQIVQYTDSDQSDYCHPVLYRFAYWSGIIALILKILSCCQSSSKIAAEFNKRKHNKIPTITIDS